jgi:hypothetical protein
VVVVVRGLVVQVPQSRVDQGVRGEPGVAGEVEQVGEEVAADLDKSAWSASAVTASLR